MIGVQGRFTALRNTLEFFVATPITRRANFANLDLQKIVMQSILKTVISGISDKAFRYAISRCPLDPLIHPLVGYGNCELD